MTEIYLSSNHLMLKSGYGDPQMHSHLAAHVLVSLNGTMEVLTEKQRLQCAGALIPSGCAHTVRTGGEPVLVFLFDATTAAAERISAVREVRPAVAAQIAASYGAMCSDADIKQAYAQFFAQAMELLRLPVCLQRPADERILAAIAYTDEHIAEELTAAQAACAVSLSESRFSHLFREQVGVTFASYALLRKLYHAYTAIAASENITQAAMAAGFASPSHFAAVNKRMFGITASEVCGSLKLYRMDM